MRLVCWVVIGGAVASSSYLALLMPISQMVAAEQGARILRGIIFSILFCSGMAISLLTVRRLGRGVDADVWTEAELAPLRKRLNHPAWIAAALLFIAAYIGSALETVLNHGTAFLGFLIIPAILIPLLKTVIRPRQTAKDRGLA